MRVGHRMTRMTGPDCSVMCNLIIINTHTHTHTNTHSEPERDRGSLSDHRQDDNVAAGGIGKVTQHVEAH